MLSAVCAVLNIAALYYISLPPVPVDAVAELLGRKKEKKKKSLATINAASEMAVDE